MPTLLGHTRIPVYDGAKSHINVSLFKRITLNGFERAATTCGVDSSQEARELGEQAHEAQRRPQSQRDRCTCCLSYQMTLLLVLVESLPM